MKLAATTVDLSAAVRHEADRLRRLGVNSQQAVRRAGGTLLRRLPVAARRDIQQEYNLIARRINYDLSARRAGTNAVELVGRRRRIGAIQYRGRWSRSSGGATVQLRTGGGREAWDGGGAFIAKGLSGNRQIFERAGAKRRMTRGRHVGELRQPLKVQYFGSVAAYLVEGQRPDRLAGIAQDVLAAEMARLLGGAQ